MDEPEASICGGESCTFLLSVTVTQKLVRMEEKFFASFT
jgi:hypothetical protein